MTHARYGRMSLGRCVIKDYGHVGCSADVLSLMDSRCSGRQTCQIRIPDPMLSDVRPCPDDFKTFMKASYDCVQGMVCKILGTCISSNVAAVCSLVQWLEPGSPPGL